jgi:hypothetical protein
MKNELASNFMHSDDVLLGTVIQTPIRYAHTFCKGLFDDAILPGLPEAGGKAQQIVVPCGR